MTCTQTKKPVRYPLAATTSDAPPVAAELAATLTALPGGLLDGGEIVLLAVKPSMWRPIFESTAWLVTCLLLASILILLQTPLPGLSMTTTAQVVLIFGLARLAVAVIRWSPTWYVLTNRRIIHIAGVRSPRVTPLMLISVRNTYVTATIAERLARLGSITMVSTHENGPHIRWLTITRPDDVHTRIRRAIENAIDNNSI